MRTLVLLHGWGATGDIWRHQAGALAGQGAAVLTPTFPVWEVSWLTGFLQQLPLSETVVVGWSLGGMLLLEALSQGSIIPGGVILVATPLSFCVRPDYPWGQPPAVVRALRRALRQDSRRALADFAGRCLAPGEADFQEEIFKNFQPQPNGPDLPSGLDYLLNADLRPQMSGIPGGVLIIQGEEDAIVSPGQAEILAECLKEARVVRLSGAGHAPFLTRAGEFNEILGEFFKGRGPGTTAPCPSPHAPNHQKCYDPQASHTAKF